MYPCVGITRFKCYNFIIFFNGSNSIIFSSISEVILAIFFFSLFIQVAYKSFVRVHLVCFCYCCSVTKSCPTLCDSMDCSTPGFLVLYYIPEFALIHVHWVSDAIQPCHSLLPPPPLCLKLSQHQGLFQWVSSSNQVTKELKLQHQLFQLIFRIDYLQDWLVWSPCSPRDFQMIPL